MVMPKITNFMVINLKESTTRREHMLLMLRKKGISPQFVTPQRPKKGILGDSSIKLGEIGVWFGHQRAWQAVLANKNKHEFTLIMEDDVLLSGVNVDYTNLNVAVPQDAHMVFLHSR
jgi:GR25 family glycosyltransferase involved in LPS biosynthesis